MKKSSKIKLRQNWTPQKQIVLMVIFKVNLGQPVALFICPFHLLPHQILQHFLLVDSPRSPSVIPICSVYQSLNGTAPHYIDDMS